MAAGDEILVLEGQPVHSLGGPYIAELSDKEMRDLVRKQLVCSRLVKSSPQW